MTVRLWLYDYDCMTMTVWLWLYDYDCMTMTVMTENKLETNQQQQEQEQEEEKWYLEPPFAVKNYKCFSDNSQKLSRICQNIVKKNVKNLSKICPKICQKLWLTKIWEGVRWRRWRWRRRRVLAPRPGGDFVAPGKNVVLFWVNGAGYTELTESVTSPSSNRDHSETSASLARRKKSRPLVIIGKVMFC
jgi:hypothetical protein